MKIERVTFTGADESVTAEAVLRVAKKYSVKTEWGLLLSKRLEGTRTRYPSISWMESFVKLMSENNIATAGHLQGVWLKELCNGVLGFAVGCPTLYPYFGRMQLNFHGEKAKVVEGFYHHLVPSCAGPTFMSAVCGTDKQFIFQMDGMNDDIYYEAYKRNNSVVPLFDTSAGAGITPDKWLKPIHSFNGYAGGLGPKNIKEQLKKIEDVVGDGVIWIDMESNIRSEDDHQFDLDKCCQVLDIISESNYV